MNQTKKFKMNCNLTLKEEISLLDQINKIEIEISMSGKSEKVLLDKIYEMERKIVAQKATNKIIKLSTINSKNFSNLIQNKFDPKIDRLYKELNLLMNLTKMRILWDQSSPVFYFISSSMVKIGMIDDKVQRSLNFWPCLIQFLKCDSSS